MSYETLLYEVDDYVAAELSMALLQADEALAGRADVSPGPA